MSRPKTGISAATMTTQIVNSPGPITAVSRIPRISVGKASTTSKSRCATTSATAAVVAEFVASDRGLGYLLLQYNGNLETPMVFAVIVLLSLIGLAVYYVVEIIERITIPWHVSQQPTDVTLT